MSSTELQAARLIGGATDAPADIRRRSARSRRSSSRRRANGSIAWGSLDGLESQVLGPSGGPRRVEPASGFSVLQVMGLGVLLVGAALAAHWVWQQGLPGQPGPEDQAVSSASMQALPDEPPAASGTSPLARAADALPVARPEDARPPVSMAAPQPEPGAAQASAESPREDPSVVVVPASVTTPVMAPVAMPSLSRPKGRKLGPAPVPTLFLDDVPEDPVAANHEPVTLELFKASLPERSSGTDPQRHAAGAVSPEPSIR